LFGYLISWISLIIGFSSPVALAALAMSKYLSVFDYNFGKLCHCSYFLVALPVIQFKDFQQVS
jgi:APA family basic amino acid/polyamine antiporter